MPQGIDCVVPCTLHYVSAGRFAPTSVCACTWCATERIRSSANRLPTMTAQIGCGPSFGGGCVCAGPPRPPPPCCGTSNLYGTTAHGCPVCALAPTSAC